MASEPGGVDFKIWAVDNQVYGPVELPVLVGWVKEERVTADTWIFSERDDAWQKAAKVPELQMFFRPKPAGAGTGGDSTEAGLKPGVLRRVKILANLDDPQLVRFAK